METDVQPPQKFSANKLFWAFAKMSLLGFGGVATCGPTSLMAIAVGLLLSTALGLVSLRASVGELLFVPLTFLSLLFLGLNPLWLIGLGALAGGLGWLGS